MTAGAFLTRAATAVAATAAVVTLSPVLGPTSAVASTTPVVETAAHTFVVHWGDQVDGAQAVAVAGLFGALDGSGYLLGLSAAYPVSPRAVYDGAAMIPNSSLPSDVSDSSIASTVATAVANGVLPAPTGDTNYVVMLPPGVTPTTQQTPPPCSEHEPVTIGSTRAQVIVLPDYGSNAKQCGAPTADAATAATINAAQQLVNAVTDPAGVAAGTGIYRTGTTTEVADACVGVGGAGALGNVDGFVVAPWWSNSSSACTFGTTGVTIDPDVDAVTNAQQATFLLHDTESTQRQAAWSCSVDNNSATCGTTQPLSVSGVAAGRHTVAVQAAGVGSATYSWLVDLSPPVASMVGPTASVTAAKTVTVSFTGSDTGGAGVRAYDVRYRVSAWNGRFGYWTQPAAWQGTARTRLSLTVRPGRTYCFSARAQDAAGNVQQGWSAARCTTVPVDDRTLAAGPGWQRLTSRSAFAATLTRSAVPGSRLRLARAYGRRIALLVRTCPTCGRIAVYRGGVLWRTVNTHSTTTRNRVLVTLPAFSLRTTTIWLQVVGSRTVYVDGVAVEQV